MALLNRNIKRLVQNLSEATKSKKYLAEFVQVVASDETFAKRLTFAIETELQDRHYRKENGRDVGKKT